MEQKEYHNYPIGTVIYPRDNSYQKLIHKNNDWDGEDHSYNLYLKPCTVVSKEFTSIETMYGIKTNHHYVHVEYCGAVYRVLISEFWDMTTPPSWIDELEDMYGEYPFDYVW